MTGSMNSLTTVNQEFLHLGSKLCRESEFFILNTGNVVEVYETLHQRSTVFSNFAKP